MSNRESKAIEEALHKPLLEKTNFWQKVLERLLNVTLMLTTCNPPFCGSSEKLSNDNKGNFLSIIQLLAKYNTVLDKLYYYLKVLPRYFCPSIQNGLMSSVIEEVFRDIKGELQSVLFLPLLLIPPKVLSEVK